MIHLLAGLLACAPDPTLDPVFVPPTDEDPVRVAVEIEPRAFRVGEAIPIDLVVSTVGKEGRKSLDTTLNTPRGRVSTDIWAVRPIAGASDPGVYWEDMGGGQLLRRNARLQADATHRERLALNDWVRFDRPGTYALQLHTTRVGDLDLIAPMLTIDVVARDPAADAARVAELIAVIDAGGPEREDALRELAWIGSPETLDLAVSRLSSGAPDAGWWEIVVAMHPELDRAIRELDAALIDPGVGVRAGLIEARVAAAYGKRFDGPIGAMPPKDHDPSIFRYRALKTRREGDRSDDRDAALTALAGKLAEKEPEARAITLATLAERLFRAETTPAWAARVVPVLRSEFATLEPATIEVGLADEWAKLADPALVAPLLELIRAPATPVSVRDLAVRRLVALDPAAAEPVILALLEDPRRPVTLACDRELRGLASVPENTRQRLVADISQASDPALHMRLVATYAGPGDADAVMLEWNNAPADLATGAIAGYAAYFLRNKPERARPMLDRYGPGHHMLLLETAELIEDPKVLLPRALEALRSHPEQAVFLMGSEYVREHGDRAALDELLKMLPKAKEQRQESVAAAIMTSRAWLMTIEDRRRLEGQLTDRRADMIVRHGIAADDPTPIIEIRWDEDVPVMSLNYFDYVGEDAIRTKLAQFKPGTLLNPRFSGREALEGLDWLTPIAEGVQLRVHRPKGI